MNHLSETINTLARTGQRVTTLEVVGMLPDLTDRDAKFVAYEVGVRLDPPRNRHERRAHYARDKKIVRAYNRVIERAMPRYEYLLSILTEDGKKAYRERLKTATPHPDGRWADSATDSPAVKEARRALYELFLLETLVRMRHGKRAVGMYDMLPGKTQ